ncbi:MAG: ECF transporter S component [Chloroflexota bacterium]|nr:ECF transporter S component [Anaerolineae bacterium]
MTTQATTKTVTRIPRTYIYALVPAAVALNIVGGYINGFLNLPTFLDMIGTCVVAVTVGPWWGALAGAATNLISGFTSGPIGIPFAACNVVGALVWGYGVRWGMGKSFVRFFILSLLVALFVTLMAVPIYVFIFGGATGHFADVMTAAFLGMGQHLIVSVFSSNILVSLADKIISSFVALAILEALPPSLTKQVTIVGAPKLQTVIWITAGLVISALLIFLVLYGFG